MFSSLLKSHLPTYVFFVLVLCLWQGVVVIFNIHPFLCPSPLNVVSVAYENWDELFLAMLSTAKIAIYGLLLSIVVGFLISLVMSQAKVIERSLFPYAIFFQAVPIVAIAPIFILWFGAGTQSMIMISFVISLFPIITNSVVGLTQIEKEYFELFEVYKANRLEVLLKLRIPHAISNLITGIKVSAGLAVVGAIVGEYFTGLSGDAKGLAYLIQSNQQHANYAYLFATSIAASCLGFLIFLVVQGLGDWVLTKGHFRRG